MSADDKEQEEATREKKPKMSKKKKGAIVAGIFLVLIVIIAGVVYYMGHRYYTKTNYMTDDEVQALIEKQKEEQQEKETEEETTVEEEVDPELLEAQQNMAQYASTEPITTDGNVYNIMLVLSAYGLPMAVSKLVSAKFVAKQFKNAASIFKCALIFATCTGGIAALLLFFGADFIENVFYKGVPGMAIPLRILAPTIFLWRF